MANPMLMNGTTSPFSIYGNFDGTNFTSYTAAAAREIGAGIHKLGTRGYLDDGRVFYWCQHTLSTTLTKGLVYGNAAAVANDQNRTWAGTQGAQTCTVTCGGAVTANTYADGYFLADSGTGAGQYFKIKDHAASDGSNIVTLNLYDRVTVTAASTPTGSLQKNPFADLVVFPGNASAAVVIGVPQVTVAAGNTTTQYFWCQTQGPAAVSCEGSVTIGLPLTVASAATGDAGQLKAVTEIGTAADTLPLVGYVLIANGTDEHHALVDLRIRA